MNTRARKQVNIIAAIGLALGGVFGMLGTFAGAANVRSAAWAIDGAGLVMAASLLSVKFSTRNSILASGFLVFAIGEGVMLSGTAGRLEASVPSFAAGTALWATALLLINMSNEFPIWVRAIGLVAAILFAITSRKIFWGAQILPTSSPLPFFAYPFLVLSFAGWIWALLTEKPE